MGERKRKKKDVGGKKEKKKNFVRLQPRDSNSRPSRFPRFPIQYANITHRKVKNDHRS